MKKKKKVTQDGILFCGQAAEEVTGSMYHVRFGKHQILLECGLYQSSTNSYLDAYRVNSRKFPFNPAEIDYVFICHAHIDHSGLLPRLVKSGFRGKIIMTSKTKEVLSLLLPNSQGISSFEVKYLNRHFGNKYRPLYDKFDVDRTLSMVKTYDDYDQYIELEDGVRFKWISNAHCIGATQLILSLSDGRKTRKIHYTSDLGALNPNNHYVSNTAIPKDFSDVSIMESTYADPQRVVNKTRSFDIEHLKAAIETTIAKKGTLIFPAFSFSRTQEVLTCIYELYGNDENAPLVYVDSPLSVSICRKYQNIVPDKDIKLWGDVISWKKLRLVKDAKISETIVNNRLPKIVISSSGFCTNGRIINYLQKYLKDPKSLIIFSGYVGDNPSYLSYRIKYGKTSKTIKVNGQVVPNRANCMSLYTFSNHIGHSGLVEFGSSLNTNKVILVHGDKDGQEKLKPILQEEICRKNKTYKVDIAYRDMFYPL